MYCKKVIGVEDIQSLPFPLDHFWSAPFEDLNGSGRDFHSEEMTDSDMLLFVEESDQDNRYMKGGGFSTFGTVYGIHVNIFQDLYNMDPEDAGFDYV